MWERIKRYRTRWILLCLLSLTSGFFIYKEWIRPYAILKKNTHSIEWKFKAQHFSKLRHRNMHVFFGNSLTVGLGAYLSAKDSVMVCGINGDFTEGLLKRMDTILAQQPRTVHIEIGINDILAGIGKKTILRNYRKIVLKLLEYIPPKNVFLQSILPVSFKDGWMCNAAEANGVILSVNAGIRSLCAEYKLNYVDLHCVFSENGKLTDKLTSDGVHLTDAGYKLWLQQLKVISTGR